MCALDQYAMQAIRPTAQPPNPAQATKGKAFTDNASVSVVGLPGGKALALSGGSRQGAGGPWRRECLM